MKIVPASCFIKYEFEDDFQEIKVYGPKRSRAAGTETEKKWHSMKIQIANCLFLLQRPVDPDHVRVLTEEFRRSSSQFVELASHVNDGIDTDILREPACGVSVETLGDNHTRIALQ